MKKVFFAFALVVALIGSAYPPAAAGPTGQAIYTSDRLAIHDWHIHRSTHTFDGHQMRDAILKVDKLTPDRRVALGLVLLNGRLIPLTRFLTGTKTQLDEPIQLQAINRMRVFLLGLPGAAIRIAIHRPTTGSSPSPPPCIRFTATPGTIQAGAAATLSWTVTQAHGCTITPGIGTVDHAGSISVFPVSDTTYTLVAEGDGGRSTSMAVVRVDTAAPRIAIQSPADGGSATQSSITVSGTVHPADARVRVNGMDAMVDSGYFFADAVPLDVGDNLILATADRDRRTAEARVTVTRAALDLTPVSVEIFPADPQPADLKINGTARIAILNAGTVDITTPYRVVLVEDLHPAGIYDPDMDNRLGQSLVDTVHPAGASLNIDLAYAGELAFRDSRFAAYVDADHVLAETDEGNNIVRQACEGVDLSASRLIVDTDACPTAATVRVRLGNAGSLNAGPPVPVSLYGQAQNGELHYIATDHSTLPLTPGQFEDILFPWSLPSADTVKVVAVVNDDGHSPAASVPENPLDNNRVIAPWPGCQSNATAPGSISGRVVQATDGSFMSGAVVTLRSADAGGNDAPLAQTQTDSTGGFAFSNLPPGDYHLSATGAGCVEDQRSVHLIDHAAGQDLFLSPAPDPEAVRIILSWGETPADLEAHLTGPNPDGCRHHCFYWNRQIPGARLDTDATGGYGPETITLSGDPEGVYRYYVHNFTDRLAPDGRGLANSEARVRVLFGDGRTPLTFRPPDRSGTVWHVFDIDTANGLLTPVNRMGYQDEPGSIDFPVIRSTPPVRAAIDTPYAYTVQAVDPDTDHLLFRLLEAPAGMHIDPLSGRIDWTPGPDQMGRHPVTVSVRDDGCGEARQQFTVSIALLVPPQVSFGVRPCNGFNPDGDITLEWQTKYADWIEIDNGIGPVSDNGRLALPSPASRIAYTLTAGNAVGTTTQVAVGPSAVDEHFTICDSAAADQYLLAWNLPCATECALTPDIGPVPCSGTMAVTRNGPGEFILSGSNPIDMHWRLTRNAGYCGGEVPDAGVQTVCAWNSGDPVKITWHAPWARSVRIEPEVGAVPNTGSATVAPLQPATYTIIATDAYGHDFSRTVDVPVIRAATIDAAGADPSTIPPGQATELYWAAPCADSCRIDSDVGPDIGSVENVGRRVVTPGQLPASYTVTAIKAGVAVDSETVTIGVGAPAISFSASPGIVKPGERVTLRWQVQQADACWIESDNEPDIGAVDLSGSIDVQPAGNTIYVLRATGHGGTSTARASVTYVKPGVHIQADPESVFPGGSSVLTWVFSHADRCEIDQGIGEVDLGGQVVVSPMQETAYTLTATGPGGMSTAQTVVGCNDPELQLDISPRSVHAGESAVLTWSFSGALDGLLSPGIGPVPPSGSVEITPTRDATYVLSTVGCSGPIQASASVSMACPPEIRVVEPDGMGDRVSAAYRIQWEDADCDDDASISIFYDDDPSGADGTLIAGGLHEDPDVVMDRYTWDTSAMPDGEYYIYLVIDDGRHDPVVAYSNGRITVDHTLPPLTDTLLHADGMRPTYVEDDIDIHGDTAIVGYRGYGACIYTRSQGIWQLTQVIECPDENFRSQFGASVGISGDWAVVGVMQDWPQWGQEPGAAYMFHREQDGWVFHSQLAPSQANVGLYGTTVAIDGDVAVVSTRGASAYMGFEDPGRVFVFRLTNNIWLEEQVLMPADSAPYDYFGHSVEIDQDVVVIGADRSEYLGSGFGSAYVFRFRDGQWVEESALSDGLSGSGFGRSVSVSGRSVIVGAPNTRNGNYGAGMAYIYQKGAGADDPWQLNASLALADPASSDHFGSAVSIEGRFAVVGAMGRDVAGTGSGVAYVYRQEGDAWIQRIGVSAGDAAATRRFGAKVAMDDGGLLVMSDNAVHMFTTCGASLAIDPVFLAPGESAALRWDTQLAEQVAITPAPGVVQPQGQANVAPADTTTYTLHAAGPYGETFQSTTVRVGTWQPIASIRADQDSVLAGESVTLSWATDYANAVSIEPGVGSVDADGSVMLSPTGTTSYVITARGPGGSTTAQVTVAVAIPQPTAQLTLTPAIIDAGQSVTLSWSTQHATAVSISPSIGPVTANGSMETMPGDTTTFVLTAIGPGGRIESQAAVEVVFPPPVVELSVDPSIVDRGAPITLSWVTQHAHSCTIEPEVGTVDTTGTIQLTPTQTTDYTLTATGPGGTTTQNVTVTVNDLSPIQIEILSPTDGDFINRPDVMVRGTFSHATGIETGIVVNGKVAMVYGNQFAVNHIPLVEGENTIIVRATDVDGNLLTESISLTASHPEHYIQMHANIESRTPPLETNLVIGGTFSIEGANIAYSGAGPVEFLESEDDRFRIRMANEGFYYLTAEADFGSSTYTDTIALITLDTAEIDALLQQKWADMKAALIANDIERALAYHQERSRDTYSVIYNALGSDLPSLASQMQDISSIYCIEDTAKYRIYQDHEMNGEIVTISYYIYFVRDENGIWLVDKY